MLQTSTDKPKLLMNLPLAQRKAILAAAIQEAIENKARAGLTEFAQYVDPNAAKWYRAPHLRRASDFATRITQTPRGRGILIMPPRHWKSSLCSEKLPAWYLGNHPDHSLIEATNSDTLALSFSRNIRSIIESPRFRSLFDVRLRRGSNEVQQWSLEQA